MAIQLINRGLRPNDNTGDNLREGARKINEMMTEIYGSLGRGGGILFNYDSYKLNEITDVDDTARTGESVLAWDTTTGMWTAQDKLSGNVVGHMIPNMTHTWDLGSMDKNFRDFYISGNTIFNPDSQRVFSKNQKLMLQYDYETSNALMFDSAESSAGIATSQDIYFSNTVQMDAVNVSGNTIFVFPGVDLATSPPYSLQRNIVVELTFTNAGTGLANTYSNYDESVYGSAGPHEDAFYFSGTTSVTVKNGTTAVIEDDLANATHARLVIKRVSQDGIGEIIVSNKTQSLTNKTIEAANNTILMSVGDLFDVATTGANTANNGDILIWRNAEQRWTPGNPEFHAIAGPVSGSLIPNADSVFDLGDATHKFKDLYLSGTSLHLGDTTITSSSNLLEFSTAVKLGNAATDIQVSGDLMPITNSLYDLGSAEKKFRHLYLSDSTLYIGNSSISVNENGIEYVKQVPVKVYEESKTIVNFDTSFIVPKYPSGDPLVQGYIFEVPGLSDSAFGLNALQTANIVTLSVADSYLNTPFEAKLHLYAGGGYKPIKTFDMLKRDQYGPNQENEYVIINGTSGQEFSHPNALIDPVKEGFVMDEFGNLLIFSQQTLAAFKDMLSDMNWNPTAGNGFAVLEVYDATGSTTLSLKPRENPLSFEPDMSAPATPNETGEVGQMVFDSGYMYVCISKDLWVRYAVETSW
ncbi:hypothetical protein EB155_01435 [archaeon]|nr:hypothetical protein [archaeon]